MIWQGMFILFITGLAGNSNASRKPLILYGQNAFIQDFPYQASLRRFNQHFCGGSIISERHILTSGHCVYEEQSSFYNVITVVTGTSDTNGQGYVYEIASITVHPSYAYYINRFVHDIAIITLQNTIVFNAYQQKINLPLYNYRVGDRAVASGWGLIQQSPKLLPNQLQSIVIELASAEECRKKIFTPIVYDSEMCAIRNSASSTCAGDSGGPVSVNGVLVGIVSWFDGHVCANSAVNVFTNVYAYLDFIRSAMLR